jgi:hAT family C-terminal dimerisation region
LRHATDLGTYPALAVLLHIFAMLPVTTATGERSFSALKYLKKLLAVNNE